MTLTYCLYELSMSTEFQSEARESVQSAVRKYNGELTFDAVNEMVYLDQCIYGESLKKIEI